MYNEDDVCLFALLQLRFFFFFTPMDRASLENTDGQTRDLSVEEVEGGYSSFSILCV